jgi:hypothetical protein
MASKTAKVLPRKKVLEAIEKLPAKLKGPTLKIFDNKKLPLRHGSEEFRKEHPEIGVDQAQAKHIVNLRLAGVAFRSIEQMMKLIPASGNDAKRVVDNYLDAQRRKAKSVSDKARRQRIKADKAKPAPVEAKKEELAAVSA